MPPSPALLFPAIEPFADGLLDVGDGHRLYFEQCGNPAGLPAIFLHGGPGSGCNPNQRRLFDPAAYRAVLFDQRGCGRSTPRGGLRFNTTAHLIADIERLRSHLGIARWLVVGGSWGSSLGIAYAAQHREACLGLLLRGVFLTGKADLDWFFQGAAALLPDAWAEFAGFAPSRHRRDLLRFYDRVLGEPDAARAQEAVRRWVAWEEALQCPGRTPPGRPAVDAAGEDAARLLDKYRLQAHYLTRRCFLDEPKVLDAFARAHGIPAAILHGRLDWVCRPANAWRAHRTLHGSRLRLVDGAGHNPFDPPMTAALLEALAQFAARGDFAQTGAVAGGAGPAA